MMKSLDYLILSLGLLVLVFAGSVPVSAQTNNTSTTDSFHANGLIATMIGLQASNQSLVLAGDWALAVIDGNATGLYFDFTMTDTAGFTRHYMSFSDFRSNDTSVQLNPNGVTTISGTVDLRQSFNPVLEDINITMDILNGNIIRISTTDERVRIAEHFQEQPIYGTIDSLRDDINNVQLVEGPRP